MRGEIISYIEMCQNEGLSLQKGMNFDVRSNHPVILMSVRKNAPYHDQISEDGTELIYEGHDVPKRANEPDPKRVDQMLTNPSGSHTENGKFYAAAEAYKEGRTEPACIQVYEKIKPGIWSDNGLFSLVDAWKEFDGTRSVYKFKLRALSDYKATKAASALREHDTPNRIIPSSVKLEVWKRDGGKCVMCGATSELHFDHIVPFSKGGTSVKADNIQLLCARHNLEKSNKIE